MLAICGSSCNFFAKQKLVEHCHDVSIRVIAGECHVLCVWIFFMPLGSFKEIIPELREVVSGGFGGHIV